MMPVRDGLEFRQRQLADPALADVPVVLVTASGRAAATKVGATAVLFKPVSLQSSWTGLLGKLLPVRTTNQKRWTCRRNS
jgi:CheY-like chemotaxis protein